MSSTLEVPAKEKRARPKSPRRKAPTAPKKKDSNGGGKKQNKPQKDSLKLPEAEDLEKNSKVDKSLKRSISPRAMDGYSSLLDEMVGMGDMVLLDPITEDSVIQNLKKRYVAGEIYVRKKQHTL